MRFSKWGDSLAVRLPRKLAKWLGLISGDELGIGARAKDKMEPGRLDQRKETLARIRERGWRLPPDYRFDRDEANER